jgi:hypothetical protein
MKTSSLPRCAAWLLLAGCLAGADCGGDPGEVGSGDRAACSNLQGSNHERASGRFDVTVNGRTVGPWRLGVLVAARHDGTYDVQLSACVLEGDGAETWRHASVAHLPGPVRETPVKLPVPRLEAPGFSGGLLDVVGNREHHFLLRGAGELEVREFDPEARRFIARGEMYPEQGGTVTLSWDVTW